MKPQVWDQLKGITCEENVVLALPALNAYISAQPDHLPLIAATGVRLLQADYVSQPYIKYHCCIKLAIVT